MKKILMIYASKTGTTKDCAEAVKDGLNDLFEITLIDHKQKLPDLKGFDAFIVGTPIRMGRFHSGIKSFLKGYRKAGEKKDLYLFVCCGSDEKLEQYYRDNIPHDLMNDVKLKMSFGGEYRFSKAKGVEKKILESIMKSYIQEQKPMPKTDQERIDRFCDRMSEILLSQSEEESSETDDLELQ